MDVILDTCGFLSLVGLAQKKLSSEVLRIIEEAPSVYLSAGSLFEIVLKHKKGMISLKPFDNALALWSVAMDEYRMTELPVTGERFFTSTVLEDFHADPFDRIIIAEAKFRNLTVVTYDRLFSRYGIPTMC
jgi:PIN domain nuclease of toxin-antitoxin system